MKLKEWQKFNMITRYCKKTSDTIDKEKFNRDRPFEIDGKEVKQIKLGHILVTAQSFVLQILPREHRDNLLEAAKKVLIKRDFIFYQIWSNVRTNV